VSRGQLWVLDGATATPRRVPTPGMTALDPQFSRDGRWLAFLGTGASPPAAADTASFTGARSCLWRWVEQALPVGRGGRLAPAGHAELG
jgi:hypothetical protein